MQALLAQCSFFEDEVGQHLQQTLPNNVFNYFPCWSLETSDIEVVTSLYTIEGVKIHCTFCKKRYRRPYNTTNIDFTCAKATISMLDSISHVMGLNGNLTLN